MDQFEVFKMCAECGEAYPEDEMEQDSTGNWQCGCTLTDEEINRGVAAARIEIDAILLRQSWSLPDNGHRSSHQ